MENKLLKFIFIAIADVFTASVLISPLLAQSTEITITAIKDNTIYSEADNSNGAGDYLFTGNNQRGDIRRGLIAFNLSEVISAQATIESVTLTLNMSRTVSGPQEVTLHRLLADWGEGVSDAQGQEGGGATATTGDATWRHRFFNTDLWANEGGDFSITPSAALTVDRLGSYTWGSTEQMVAEVQLWVDKPDSNFGWILRENESASRTTKRFDSRNNSDKSVQPMLTVTFSVTSVDNRSENIPAEFDLAQNYPNPFNPTTVINYTIPQSHNVTNVKLEIFNILGQKVRTLVNTPYQAGSHSVRWDGADDAGELLAVGVYVYRLQAGRFVERKKMLFLR
ncbi:MAG: DNRLRE domain-containing protein [bacterium]